MTENERTPEEAKQYAARATIRYAEVVADAWDKMGELHGTTYSITAAWIDDVLVIAARGTKADQLGGYMTRENLAKPNIRKTDRVTEEDVWTE